MLQYFSVVGGAVTACDTRQSGGWTCAVNPDPTEIAALIEEYGLESDFVYAALDEEESSRIENEDGNVLMMIDTPVVERKEDGSMSYSTVPLGIIIVPDQVITVSLRSNLIMEEFAQGMVKNTQTNLKTQFVLRIMLRVAGRYLQFLKQIDKISGGIEKKLRHSLKNKELIQMLELRKSLVYFSTSLKGNLVTLEKLTRGRYVKLYEEDQDLLDDVLIEVRQALEMSETYLDILSGTMDAFASLISNNLNVVMKVLAAITIVFSVPNVIAGIYGMNVPGLPMAEYWWFPVALSGVIMLLVYLILRKRDML